MNPGTSNSLRAPDWPFTVTFFAAGDDWAGPFDLRPARPRPRPPAPPPNPNAAKQKRQRAARKITRKFR